MVKLGKLIGQLGILLLSVIQTIAIAQSSQEVTRDQVSFGSVLSDSEISTVINRYNVKPKAVFMWMSGLSATHRVDEDLSVEEIRVRTYSNRDFHTKFYSSKQYAY